MSSKELDCSALHVEFNNCQATLDGFSLTSDSLFDNFVTLAHTGNEVRARQTLTYLTINNSLILDEITKAEELLQEIDVYYKQIPNAQEASPAIWGSGHRIKSKFDIARMHYNNSIKELHANALARNTMCDQILTGEGTLTSRLTSFIGDEEEANAPHN